MSQTSKTLDEQFIVYMLEIDARYKVFPKSDRAKIEQWVSQSYCSRYLVSQNYCVTVETRPLCGSETGTYTLCCCSTKS